MNIIKEVLSFFEENSFGEDYHMSLEDEEISNSPDGDSKSSNENRNTSVEDSNAGGLGAHSSQGNASTGDDGSIRYSK